ncbi:hypothetical protein A3Q56_00122 [Intoshia linei]|uniref:Uncharacterized protein n=1 Tax=Intoshia linei TaxID=1819745 RepID=A0A177BCQ3_9BILA|nr:hypothetical protein A3Q56_00122 [Intoshia linei]
MEKTFIKYMENVFETKNIDEISLSNENRRALQHYFQNKNSELSEFCEKCIDKLTDYKTNINIRLKIARMCYFLFNKSDTFRTKLLENMNFFEYTLIYVYRSPQYKKRGKNLHKQLFYETMLNLCMWRLNFSLIYKPLEIACNLIINKFKIKLNYCEAEKYLKEPINTPTNSTLLNEPSQITSPLSNMWIDLLKSTKNYIDENITMYCRLLSDTNEFSKMIMENAKNDVDYSTFEHFEDGRVHGITAGSYHIQGSFKINNKIDIKRTIENDTLVHSYTKHINGPIRNSLAKIQNIIRIWSKSSNSDNSLLDRFKEVENCLLVCVSTFSHLNIPSLDEDEDTLHFIQV